MIVVVSNQDVGTFQGYHLAIFREGGKEKEEKGGNGRKSILKGKKSRYLEGSL